MSSLRVYMSGPPSQTEVTVSAGHAALTISAYAINPNVATLARTASISIAGRSVTSISAGAPVVVSVSTSSLTSTSAVVSWTVDQPVTGRVEYGTTVSYGSFTTNHTTPITSHAQTVSGLTAGTLYHFRVIGQNAAGQAYASSDQTFTTTTAAIVLPGSVLATNLTYSPPTVSSEPAYLATRTDPVFGTTIRRITEGLGDRHHYSNMPAWNCDMTRIAIPGGADLLLDASDYSVIRTGVSFPQWELWSFVDPDKMYGGSSSSGGSYYRELVPSTNAVTTRNLTRPGGGSYYQVSCSGGEQTGLTWNDRYLVFGFRTGSTGTGDSGMGIIDTTTRTVVAERVFTTISSQKSEGYYWPAGGMGITGETVGGLYYISASWGQPFDGTALERGLEVYSFNPSTNAIARVRNLGNYGRHSDVGKDMAGNWVAATYAGESGGGIGYFNMLTGDYQRLRQSFPSGHVSQRCWQLPGYALFSCNVHYTSDTRPGVDELLMFELKSGGLVHRFGNMHRRFDYGYSADPMACISTDGSAAIWSSVWDNATSGRVFAYVAGMNV